MSLFKIATSGGPLPGADPFDLLFSDQSARLSTALDDMSDDHVGDVDNVSR